MAVEAEDGSQQVSCVWQNEWQQVQKAIFATDLSV